MFNCPKKALVLFSLCALSSVYGMDLSHQEVKKAAITRDLRQIFPQEEQYGDIERLMASIQHVINNDRGLQPAQPAQPSNLNTAKQIFGNKQLNNN